MVARDSPLSTGYLPRRLNPTTFCPPMTHAIGETQVEANNTKRSPAPSWHHGLTGTLQRCPTHHCARSDTKDDAQPDQRQGAHWKYK